MRIVEIVIVEKHTNLYEQPIWVVTAKFPSEATFQIGGDFPREDQAEATRETFITNVERLGS